MSYPFPDNRRFNAYSAYLKHHYGGRLQKISIDAGLSCPNRDGSLSYGGCTFCNNNAFVPGYAKADVPIEEQIASGIRFHQRRYRRSIGYLAYFQAYTNTHADVQLLDSLYARAVAHPDVRGFIVGTRPDCLPQATIDLLAQWAQRTEVFVEIGVESCSDAALEAVNRCHDFACSQHAIRACAAAGLRVGAHLIAGLPGESDAAFVRSAATLSTLPLHSLKIHQLQVFRDTVLERQVAKDPGLLPERSLDGYLDWIIDFVEYLSPSILLERIGGEAPPQHVVSQTWGLRNDVLLQRFEQRLAERDTWQGRLFSA